jgi:ubiquinone/menaquinone biosynthesis C-methylase UbiE
MIERMSADVNVEQARAWNGDEGDGWLRNEDHLNASSRRHTARLFETVAIAADDAVLDIGCGCGETTREAARRTPSGSALGVDLSARMIERARERSRAAGITNVSFIRADAQVHPFPPEHFSLAISRFGAMFFEDPVAAFSNIRRSLRAGGRLGLLAWQELRRNEWLSAIRDALAVGRDLPAPRVGAPGPFGLADADAVRLILAEAGFVDIELTDVAEQVQLGVDAADGFAFVRTLGITNGMLQGLEEETREGALDELRTTLAAHETDEGVLLGSRAWLIRAVNL